MELFEIELTIYIKMDLALNNLQRLICHKPNQPTLFIFILLLLLPLLQLFLAILLASWVQCSPVIGETGFQSQVVLYQRV